MKMVSKTNDDSFYNWPLMTSSDLNIDIRKKNHPNKTESPYRALERFFPRLSILLSFRVTQGGHFDPPPPPWRSWLKPPPGRGLVKQDCFVSSSLMAVFIHCHLLESGHASVGGHACYCVLTCRVQWQHYVCIFNSKIILYKPIYYVCSLEGCARWTAKRGWQSVGCALWSEKDVYLSSVLPKLDLYDSKL